ncbi:MAG: CHAT domain-containing protein [Synechococcales cyanobacterium CRU_2_2]|nr:CHAT domain-containing protein [Synechococcales cyanobacterium CRU_2_2]
MHGELMTFEQFRSQALRRGDQTFPAFQRGYGLPEMEAYEGVQAFLMFEGDGAGRAIAVTAQELSDRLKQYGILACVLNACQSGKQVGGPLATNSGGTEPNAIDGRETSLGARLMDAGMQVVVAMAYSVTVSAAKLLVEELYRELLGGRGFDRAMRLARRELYEKKGRGAYFGQRVELEDWLLPVVYRNQAVDLKLRRMYPEEVEAHFTAKAARFRFGQQFRTEYGFVGRDWRFCGLRRG